MSNLFIAVVFWFCFVLEEDESFNQAPSGARHIELMVWFGSCWILRSMLALLDFQDYIVTGFDLCRYPARKQPGRPWIWGGFSIPLQTERP